MSNGENRNTPHATYALIGVNVTVYLAMCLAGMDFFAPQQELLLKWGANNRALVMNDGEWWRLLTHMFEHNGGLLHIAMNMYILYQIGPLLELNFGRLRLVMLFVLSGICGGVASNWWHDDAVSAGASGAVFGLFGAFGAYATTSLVRKDMRMSILKNLGGFLLLNLAIGFSISVIDNAAHIGGFIGGALAAYGSYFALRFPYKPNMRIAGNILPFVGAAAFCIPVWLATPESQKVQVSSMLQRMERQEEKINHAIDRTNGASGQEQLRIINEEAIPALEQLLATSDSLRTFKLTKEFARYQEMVAKYMRSKKAWLRAEAALLDSGKVNQSNAETRRYIAEMDSLQQLLKKMQ